MGTAGVASVDDVAKAIVRSSTPQLVFGRRNQTLKRDGRVIKLHLRTSAARSA